MPRTHRQGYFCHSVCISLITFLPFVLCENNQTLMGSIFYGGGLMWAGFQWRTIGPDLGPRTDSKSKLPLFFLLNIEYNFF